MNHFIDWLKGLRMAFFMRDGFLNPENKICDRIDEGTYQLVQKVINQFYENEPNSSMHSTSSTMLNSGRAM